MELNLFLFNFVRYKIMYLPSLLSLCSFIQYFRFFCRHGLLSALNKHVGEDERHLLILVRVTIKQQ